MKINQLAEEKDQKVNECVLYQKELKEKIVALQRISNELQQKVEDINTSYTQCLKELQLEYGKLTRLFVPPLTILQIIL
jgi:hypothetical protein